MPSPLNVVFAWCKRLRCSCCRSLVEQVCALSAEKDQLLRESFELYFSILTQHVQGSA